MDFSRLRVGNHRGVCGGAGGKRAASKHRENRAKAAHDCDGGANAGPGFVGVERQLVGHRRRGRILRVDPA